ncbi:DUF3107 domain-containing protein [Microlunatus speluncae]|uniref:DUF3107 domain-containing protein n=1 Tax=Microlunatus speluncae TaxID=2594267 RepID=UPI0012667799|nr:DUF3107 domain-containing protein [Microlunatus speluncae]
MEIKVGIKHVTREIVVDTSASADDVAQAFSKALESEGLLTLTDTHGRKVLIPAGSVGYLDLGEENARTVGFGGI